LVFLMTVALCTANEDGQRADQKSDSEILRNYWHHHRQAKETSEESERSLSILTDALEKRYVTLESLLQVAQRATNNNQVPRCPRYNGKVCNGPKYGTCQTGVCQCIGLWTGISCQVDPSLKDFNPLIGAAEPDPSCIGMLAEYESQC